MRTPWIPPALRPVLVFLLFFSLGLGLLLAIGGGFKAPEGPGFRIKIVDRPAGEIPPPFPGLPSLLTVLAPDYSHYDDLELATEEGGTETIRCLSWQLSCETVDADDRDGKGVVFRRLVPPLSVEEALRPASEKPPPQVEVRAGRLRWRETATRKSVGDRQWVLTLYDGVRVVSRARGRETVLQAEDLELATSEGLVASNGKVELTSKELSIQGTGLTGDVDLGSFTVLEDVVVEVPTAALLGEQAGREPSSTRISCAGPLLVERLGDAAKAAPVLTRVTFSNDVLVMQNEDRAGGADSLRCLELVLTLLVRTDALSEDTEGGVSVKKLEAVGDVELRRGDSTLATADRLDLTPLPDGERILLGGRLLFRHLGPLPLPGGETGPGVEREDRLLEVRAEKSASIAWGRETGAAKALFEGNVRTAYSLPDGARILDLAANTLRLISDPAKERELLAEGEARFKTSTSSGSGERIRWTQKEETRTEIRLEGRPKVEVRGGQGLSLLQAPAPKEGDDEVLVLSCEDEILLLEEGDRREITLGRACSVEKTAGERMILRVTADRMKASLEGEVLKGLTAEGSVTARGGPAAGEASFYSATADTFSYPSDGGFGVLRGHPAKLRLEEGGDRANEIRASRFTFHPEIGDIVAEDDVYGTVYLSGSPGSHARPFELRCDRLEVAVAPEGETNEEDTDLVGRIRSLTATGNVELAGREQTGRGLTLTYDIDGGRGEVVLTGRPAEIGRDRLIQGKHYQDLFTAREFRLQLVDREIASFRSPTGGQFILHRPFEKLWPGAMGGAEGEEGPKDGNLVERLSGACKGRLFYEVLRRGSMTGEAWVEQALGRVGSFRSVARFEAEEITAEVGKDPDGVAQLMKARGRGKVYGKGEGWEAWCDEFELEFVKHLTTVRGSPARVKTSSGELLVDWGLYDYEKDEWREFSQVRTR